MTEQKQRTLRQAELFARSLVLESLEPWTNAGLSDRLNHWHRKAVSMAEQADDERMPSLERSVYIDSIRNLYRRMASLLCLAVLTNDNDLDGKDWLECLDLADLETDQDLIDLILERT
jgi:hypothetical protein